MSGFPKADYYDGSVHIKADLSVFDERVIRAQQWLGDRVLEDCKPIMPLLSGNLQQNSKTECNGRRVVFDTRYARYLYYGKVMVDRDTGKGPRKIPISPGEDALRFRKGAKLIPTDRPLKYSRAEAVPYWFEVAKKNHSQYWTDGVKRILGGKK